MSQIPSVSVVIPSVSVVIPTYNRYHNVKLAIQSILNQTFQNFEIIVINDCSDDKQYYNGELEKYPKTTVIHLPQNLRKKYNVRAAQGKTRQIGINIAKADWIAFLDDDDYWYPNKLEIQMNMLTKTNSLFCSTNMNIGRGFWTPERQTKLYHNKILPDFFDYNTIKKTNFINTSSVIIHKSIIQKVGEFNLGKNEDYDYWLRALKFTNCLYLSQPLVYYDINHGSGKQYS